MGNGIITFGIFGVRKFSCLGLVCNTIVGSFSFDQKRGGMEKANSIFNNKLDFIHCCVVVVCALDLINNWIIMSKISPHLPAKTCHVDTYKRLVSMRWIFFVIIMSIFASVAASLSTIAWLVPMTGQSDFYLTNNENRVSGQGQPDSLLIRQTNQRTVNIYDTRQQLQSGFYKQKAKLFQSMLLSSEGWSVAFYPEYKWGEEKYWQVVDYQGIYYSVEKVVLDPTSRLLYLKIDGQGFRITSFVDGNSMNIGQSMWSSTLAEWKQVVLKKWSGNEPASWQIWQPQYFYELEPQLDNGSMVLDVQGRLVGISDEGNNLIPAWLVEQQIKTLLDKQTISYSGLPWQGYLVSGVEWEDKWLDVRGFYVSSAVAVLGVDSIVAGDLITKISGESIKPKQLAQQVYSSAEEFVVTVWREGEEIDILVKKAIVMP